MKTDLLNKLGGGDRRSIGRSDEVALEIAEDRRAFKQVFEALRGADPVVRMRAADAIEKATREHPGLLKPYKRAMLKQVALIDQQEVRWHVAQILPRLELTAKERDVTVSILLDYVEDKSSIVRTMAMQALADFALEDGRLRRRIVPLIEFMTSEGTAAMRARGRKLLQALRTSR